MILIRKLNIRGIPRDFLIATSAVLIAVVGLGSVCSVQIPRIEFVSSEPKAFIQYMGAQRVAIGDVLAGQLWLFGPDPLFLPTEWNFGVMDAVPTGIGGLSSSDAYLPAETLLKEVSFVRLWDSEVSVVTSSDLLAYQLGNRFSGLGIVSGPAERARGPDLGHYRVYSLEEEAYVGEGMLPESYDAIMDATLWDPVHFAVQVGSAGFVGTPLMMNASGSEQIDQALKTFVLQADLRFQLKKGYYRIDFEP